MEFDKINNSLSYEKAAKLSLEVKWKIELCSSGKKCWCRLIVPEIEIRDKNGNKIIIVDSGCIPTIYAEYIVKLHNESLSDKLENKDSIDNDSKDLLPPVSFNLIWDMSVTIENDFRSWLLGKSIYDMHCNSCMSFIGAYHKPEDCSDMFCPKCGQTLRNGS